MCECDKPFMRIYLYPVCDMVAMKNVHLSHCIVQFESSDFTTIIFDIKVNNFTKIFDFEIHVLDIYMYLPFGLSGMLNT